MPNWAIHLIVPLLAMLIVGKKEDYKFILLLLPLAILPDLDTFATQHRALLHNIFIPMILLFMALAVKKARMIFIISAVYIGSHVLLDMFGAGLYYFILFIMRWHSLMQASRWVKQKNCYGRWTMASASTVKTGKPHTDISQTASASARCYSYYLQEYALLTGAKRQG